MITYPPIKFECQVNGKALLAEVETKRLTEENSNFLLSSVTDSAILFFMMKTGHLENRP